MWINQGKNYKLIAPQFTSGQSQKKQINGAFNLIVPLFKHGAYPVE